MLESCTYDPFSDFPVIGQLSTAEKARLLQELGDETTAKELIASLPAAQTKSLFGGVRLNACRQPKPWEHTSHTFGFLPASPPSDKPLPLVNAAQITPDPTLRKTSVTVRLDKLRVADYPGKGVHRILFDFYARNALAKGQQEHLRFNATLRAREGQEAAAVGLPIFVNLNVGEQGLAFRCNTINVANEGSEKALEMLDSDVVKAGLKLAKTAQPAIAPPLADRPRSYEGDPRGKQERPCPGVSTGSGLRYSGNGRPTRGRFLLRSAGGRCLRMGLVRVGLAQQSRLPDAQSGPRSCLPMQLHRLSHQPPFGELRCRTPSKDAELASSA